LSEQRSESSHKSESRLQRLNHYDPTLKQYRGRVILSSDLESIEEENSSKRYSAKVISEKRIILKHTSSIKGIASLVKANSNKLK
jgi:hypothetical protein